MKDFEGTQELTIKQRKFVRAYVQGQTITDAAAQAGYSPSTAARGAAELLKSPKVRTAIQEALEKAGVTDENLATIIRDGLAAQKASHLVHGGRIQTLEAADWSARHKFVDTALRLKAAFPFKEEAVVGETYEERIYRLRGLSTRSDPVRIEESSMIDCVSSCEEDSPRDEHA